MPRRKLLLELVPPLLSRGRKGLQQSLDYIRRVADAVAIEAINIPEIHEERSRSGRGGHLTSSEARVPTLEFAARIRATCNLDCILNHVVVYEPEAHLSHWLQTAQAEYGVRQFVFVGGESSAIDYPGPSVIDANRLAREVLAGESIRIGNICIPSRANEARRLQHKIAAGVDFFTTQIVYDCEELTCLSRQLLETRVATDDVDFYVSFCPVVSARGVSFLDFLGVQLPEPLRRYLLSDPQATLQRSKNQIVTTWQNFQQHLDVRAQPLNAAINLSPIGRIPAEETIDLGTRLLR